MRQIAFFFFKMTAQRRSVVCFAVQMHALCAEGMPGYVERECMCAYDSRPQRRQDEFAFGFVLSLNMFGACELRCRMYRLQMKSGRCDGGVHVGQ